MLFGTAILVSDDREHFALLSVGLDQPGYDLETGAVRRTPTFDESYVDPWKSTDAIGRAITSAITGSSNFHKSFTINNLHGEGIEPPTYWV